MFMKKIVARICVVTVFTMTFQVSAVEVDTLDFQRIDPNDVWNELEFLSFQIKANFDKIKTWKGKISYQKASFYRGKKATHMLEEFAEVKSITDPNELGIVAIGTTEFKLDLEKKLLYRFRNRDSLEFLNFDSGKLHESPRNVKHQRTIINTPEYEIKCVPKAFKKDGTITRKMARKYVGRKFPGFYSEEDPRTFFYILISPWEQFSNLIKLHDLYLEGAADSFMEVKLEKSQVGESTIYCVQIIDPESGEVGEKIVLDSSKGFNVISVQQWYKGKVLSKITRDFAKIDGVYLPINEDKLQYDREGLLRHDENFTLSEMQINTVISEETFSIHNLGLKDGDGYLDETKGKEYKYNMDTQSLEEIQ